MGTPRPNPRDGSSLYNSQFPPRLDDSGFSQGHSVGGGGIGEPGAILPPSGPLMMPYPSHLRALKRTHSAPSVGPDVGMGSEVGSLPEMAHRPGNPVKVKFRLKGQPHSGISVAEAINRERLSQNHEYMMHDIAPDTPGKMTLKVRWTGYRSNTYSIPLSTDWNGSVNLASLARRTARAIVHFMQANGITLSWDRVVILRLEETRSGIWIPVLVTH